MLIARLRNGLPRNDAFAVILSAGLLAGCGASLNNDSLNSELQTAAIAKELTGEKKADTGAGPGPESKSGTEPVSLANAVAPKPESKSGRVAANFAKAAEPFTSAAAPGNTAYKIGSQDVLEISVFKVPELSKTAQVSELGTINLPLLGEVPAAGKTARELEHHLTAKLGAKYLQSPQVTVAVKEYNAHRVTIEGAIKKPGVYPMRSKTTLLQLTAMAEGLRDDADYSGIVIIRQVNGKRTAQQFDIHAIRSGSAPDPVIAQGDIVVVSHSAMKAAWQTFLTGLGVAGKASIFF
jgi:polysaccharide export outer membrane protein